MFKGDRLRTRPPTAKTSAPSAPAPSAANYGMKALIFDVDGTLAETEELHRAASNTAFAGAGLPWHWDQATYGRLLTATGGKERIGAMPTRQERASMRAPCMPTRPGPLSG